MSEGKKIIRVSTIAQQAWCEQKMLFMLQGHEAPETEEEEDGRRLHNMLGFNEEIPVEIDYKGYTIQGHIDRLVKYENCEIVYELKTTSGAYQTKFLLAPAHIQANIYAYMVGASAYVILVYNKARGTFYGTLEPANSERAEIALNSAIAIAKGLNQPLPTFYQWKCSICSFRDICQYGKIKVVRGDSGSK
jgi:CRISPR-associated protein Cas4